MVSKSNPSLAQVIAVDQCPICRGSEHIFLFEGSDRMHGFPQRFPVVRCLTCETVYLAKRPADLRAYYPSKSYLAYGGVSRNQAARVPGRRFGLRRYRRFIRSLKPKGGSLLDIGCGSGDFLSAMQEAGDWQGIGIEPDPEAARYAGEVRGLQVLQGEILDLELSGKWYDVITLWHVIEHVPDPTAVLKKLQGLLKPGGVLVISLPLADSWEARWFASYWAGFDVPRHLVTFTRKGFGRWIEACGLRFQEREGIVLGLASLWLSLRFWLVDKGGIWKQGHTFWVPLLSPFFFFYSRWCSRQERSVGVFTVYPGLREISP
jgi:SAM-dependent methyltransferase